MRACSPAGIRFDLVGSGREINEFGDGYDLVPRFALNEEDEEALGPGPGLWPSYRGQRTLSSSSTSWLQRTAGHGTGGCAGGLGRRVSGGRPGRWTGSMVCRR